MTKMIRHRHLQPVSSTRAINFAKPAVTGSRDPIAAGLANQSLGQQRQIVAEADPSGHTVIIQRLTHPDRGAKTATPFEIAASGTVR